MFDILKGFTFIWGFLLVEISIFSFTLTPSVCPHTFFRVIEDTMVQYETFLMKNEVFSKKDVLLIEKEVFCIQEEASFIKRDVS